MLCLHGNAPISRKITYSDTNVPEPGQSDRFGRIKVVNDCLLRKTVGIGSGGLKTEKNEISD
jgi:hypothetical protein